MKFSKYSECLCCANPFHETQLLCNLQSARVLLCYARVPTPIGGNKHYGCMPLYPTLHACLPKGAGGSGGGGGGGERRPPVFVPHVSDASIRRRGKGHGGKQTEERK